MRAVADYDGRTGIDGGTADVAHIGKRLLAQTPMARSDNDIGTWDQQ